MLGIEWLEERLWIWESGEGSVGRFGVVSLEVVVEIDVEEPWRPDRRGGGGGAGLRLMGSEEAFEEGEGRRESGFAGFEGGGDFVGLMGFEALVDSVSSRSVNEWCSFWVGASLSSVEKSMRVPIAGLGLGLGAAAGVLDEVVDVRGGRSGRGSLKSEVLGLGDMLLLLFSLRPRKEETELRERGPASSKPLDGLVVTSLM